MKFNIKTEHIMYISKNIFVWPHSLSTILNVLQDGRGGEAGFTPTRKKGGGAEKSFSHEEGGARKVSYWGGGGAKSFRPAIFSLCSRPPLCKQLPVPISNILIALFF